MKYCCRKFARLVNLDAMLWDEVEEEWYAVVDFAEEEIFIDCPYCSKKLNRDKNKEIT